MKKRDKLEKSRSTKAESCLRWALLVMFLILVADLSPAIKKDTEQLLHQSSQPFETSLPEEDKVEPAGSGKKTEKLPARYDAREHGIIPGVKEQGSARNCWAMAATTTLEACMLPEEAVRLSAECMVEDNHFVKAEEGGDVTMIMAYLAGWQGPTKESGKQDIHVQEVQLLREATIRQIKKAVYKYGAVQSSLHMDMDNAFASSVYYNQIDYAYRYQGDEEPNHDICIIGWDDGYSADKFNVNTKKDGAFICQNSWGEQFGANGIFYVSYEDEWILDNVIVYSRIEGEDNYDSLYETDLCGWVGVMGYGDSNAYFANRFTFQGNEILSAVGFYATGKDTDYKIFLLDGDDNLDHVNLEEPIAQGTLPQVGYYTIDLKEPVYLEEGCSKNVVVWVCSPTEEYPIASEYQADEKTGNVVISDGDGYISHNGIVWEGTETGFNCNVCMKVYTKEG